MQSKQKQLGLAGEYLVCADLLSQGFDAAHISVETDWDVVVNWQGECIRIQVKTTKSYKPNKAGIDTAHFTLSKRYRNGNCRDEKKYIGLKLDYIACVVLSTKEIAYIPTDELMTDKWYVKKILRLQKKNDIQRKGTRFIEFYRIFNPGCLKRFS